MSATEIAVILFGLFIGYWVVSNFLGDNKPRTQPPPGEPKQNSDSQASGQDANSFGSPMRWNEVLGVAADAGTDDIRHAYKVLMSQYHPDKVATLGVDLRNLAEEKSKAINSAYGEAMRLRGEHT